MQTRSDYPSESIRPGEDVLVLGPSVVADESAMCADLMTLSDPEQTDALWVTLTDTPYERLTVWEQYVETDPTRTSVVSVNTDARSTADSTTDENKLISQQVSVEKVSSPEDLTQLGMQIVERLRDWQHETSDRRPALCFHSLTTLLQYVTVKRTFKFLHVLGSHPVVDDTTVHYHIDSRQHDDRTITTLTEVVDVVCKYDGEWRVSR